MDYWVKNEVRARRDAVLASYPKRKGRAVAIRRRSATRTAMANAAQAMSDSLAALARSLRRGEAA